MDLGFDLGDDLINKIFNRAAATVRFVP